MIKVSRLVNRDGDSYPEADFYLFEFDYVERCVYIFSYENKHAWIDNLSPGTLPRYTVHSFAPEIEFRSSRSMKEFKQFLHKNRLRFLVLFGKSPSELLDPILSRIIKDVGFDTAFKKCGMV